MLPQPFSPSSLSLPPNSETQTIDSCHKSWLFSVSVLVLDVCTSCESSLPPGCLSSPHRPAGVPVARCQHPVRGGQGCLGPHGSHSVPQGSTRFQEVPASPGKPGGRVRRAFHHHPTVLMGNATFSHAKSVLPMTVTVKGSPCLYLSPRAFSS